MPGGRAGTSVSSRHREAVAVGPRRPGSALEWADAKAANHGAWCCKSTTSSVQLHPKGASRRELKRNVCRPSALRPRRDDLKLYPYETVTMNPRPKPYNCMRYVHVHMCACAYVFPPHNARVRTVYHY